MYYVQGCIIEYCVWQIILFLLGINLCNCQLSGVSVSMYVLCRVCVCVCAQESNQLAGLLRKVSVYDMSCLALKVEAWELDPSSGRQVGLW